MLPVDAEIINLKISLREKKVRTLLYFFFIFKIIFEKISRFYEFGGSTKPTEISEPINATGMKKYPS